MSISDAETLGARLEGIREAGHEISVGELDPNIFSIAAPVRDHTGVVIAALGVNGPTGWLSDGVQENILAAVLFNADGLFRMLGWQGDSVIIGNEKRAVRSFACASVLQNYVKHVFIYGNSVSYSCDPARSPAHDRAFFPADRSGYA